MARIRGIYGFETGDLTGLGTSGSGASDIVNNGVSARTGSYRFNSKVTGATQNKAMLFDLGTAIAGGYVDAIMRIFFRPVTFPGSNDLSIAKLGQLSLDMSTTGALRISGIGALAAYTLTNTVQGHWYQADFYLKGIEATGGVTNSVRILGAVSVYDAGIDGLTSPPTVFALLQSPQYAPSIVGVVAGGCFSPGNGYACGEIAPSSGQAFVTIAPKISNYSLAVSGATIGVFNGGYVPISDTIARRNFTGYIADPNPGVTGTYFELGQYLKQFAADFTVSNTPFGTISAIIGQSNQGPSTPREIDYDDIYYDLGTDVDAGTSIFPKGTRVQPYPIIAQGTSDQFIVAGDYPSVAEIPMNAATFVQSAVGGNATTYTHNPLANQADVAYHLRVWCNAVDNVGHTHGILIGGNEILTAFTILTGSADGNSAKADQSQVAAPMVASTFNTLQYGAKNEFNGGTLRIYNMLLEVLTGPPGLTYNDTVVLTQPISLTFTAIEGKGSPIFTVGPASPTQWALQRLDVRIEDQDDVN